MRLKEILAERKRKEVQEVEPVQNGSTSTQSSASEPMFQLVPPRSEFYALFEGCTDF